MTILRFGALPALAALLLFSSCLNKNDKCSATVNLNVPQEQLAAEISAIDAYLSENEIEAVKDESGIRYVIETPGSGKKPELCDNVYVTYSGRLMSTGAAFDEADSPVVFPLNRLITGWQIGIPKIGEGGKITLYIPSVYAYGAQEVGDIPARSNLIFTITLVGLN